MSKAQAESEIQSLRGQICQLEDELMDLKQRFEELDDMSESNSQFNEDEYENLEETIDMKDEQLIDLRSRMQCVEIISQSYN